MKKLTLAILAFLAVGATAQTRHYLTEEGVVVTSPTGIVESRVIEVTPIEVMRTLPLSVLFEVPGDEARRINVRHYDTRNDADTADINDELDELIDTRDPHYFDVLYEADTFQEREMLDAIGE